MNNLSLIFFAYMPILFGIVLIVFNKLITESYEKIAKHDGSAFPRFITTTRIIIGGVFFIVMGIVRLIENTI